MVEFLGVHHHHAGGAACGAGRDGGWALGLRQLYQPVAQEPLPAEFSELLARLDPRAAPGWRANRG